MTSSLAQDYIEGLGLGAVVTWGPAQTARPLTVESCGLPAEALARASTENRGPITAYGVLWAARPRYARLLVATACRHLVSSGFLSPAAARMRAAAFECSPEVIRESVLAAACHHGIELQDQTAIEATARAAVDLVEQEFEAMRGRGDLKDLNRSYQQYRHDALSVGDQTMTYASWVLAHKRRAVKIFAANARFIHREKH